jgi:hypothetical protein
MFATPDPDLGVARAALVTAGVTDKIAQQMHLVALRRALQQARA